MPDQYLTVEQTANYLNKTPRRIQQLMTEGVFVFIGSNHARLILFDSIEDYRRGTSAPAAEDLEIPGGEVFAFGEWVGSAALISDRCNRIDPDRLPEANRAEIEQLFANLSHHLACAENYQQTGHWGLPKSLRTR